MSTKRLLENRNHLGVEVKPERPPQSAAAAVRVEYKHDLAAWLEQNDTCVNSIYEALRSVLEALQIVEQYIVEKENLLAGDPTRKSWQANYWKG